MTDRASAYPAVPFRRLLVERAGGNDQALSAAVVAAARLLEREQVMSRIAYAGDPRRTFTLNHETVAAHLSAVRADRARQIPAVFRLADDREHALFVDFDLADGEKIDTLWFSLPVTEALTLDRWGRIVTEISRLFSAYHAAIEDERLLVLYRGRRAAERAHEALPPALRQYVPDPASAGGATLPGLLVAQEFDRRRVPDAVWWINFWDALQVSTVGDARIRAAGFARIDAEPDGGMTLVATDEPSDPANPAHVERLAHIIESLHLRQLQESHLRRS
jgi:hypothetical protein